MSRSTELIALAKDKVSDPKLTPCYGRGAVLKPEGKFHRVEVGKRSVVSRVLCLARTFGAKCDRCPNSTFTVKFRVPHVAK